MKKVLLSLAVLLALFFTATFVLNMYAAKIIKQMAQKNVNQAINSQLDFSEIKVDLIKGIYLNNVSLTKLSQEKPYLKIEKITVMPFYPSLLTTRKLLVSVIIETAQLNLIREKDGQLDLAKIFTNQKTDQSQTQFKNSFIVFKDLTLKNCSINFNDTTVNFNKTFDNVNLTAFFNLTDINLKFNYGETIILKAVYGLLNKSINAGLTLTNLNLAELNPYLKTVTIKNGAIKKADLQISGTEPYSLKGSIELADVSGNNNPLNLSAETQNTKPLDFSTNAIIYPQITVSGLFSNQPKIDYSLELSLNNCNLTYVPIVDTVSKLSADLKIDKDSIFINKASGQIFDISLTGKGTINYALDKKFSFEANSSGDLSSFISALKKIRNIDVSVEPKGKLQITASGSGLLDSKKIDYQINYSLTDGEYKDFKNIQLAGIINPNDANIESGQFIYKNLLVKLSAKFDDLAKNMKLESTINADMFTLRTWAQINNKTIALNTITLDTPSSQIKAQGSIDLQNPSQIKLSFFGNLETADLVKLTSLLDIPAQSLNQIKPKGLIELSGSLTNNLQFTDSQLKINAKAKELSLYSLPVKNIQLELNQNPKGLTVKPITADICNGRLTADFKQDVLSQKMFFNAGLDGFDLAKMREALELKQKNLSGKILLKLKIENSGLTQFNKMSGDGQLAIKEANFWEMNLLKGLGEFLFIPDFEDINFDKGYSDLFFKDDKVIFKNMELSSLKMSLAGDGTISLAGDLDFSLYPQFNQNLVDSSQGLKKYITDFLGKAGLNILVSGTVKEPKYKVNSVVTNPLQSIKNIFQNIVNPAE